MPSYLQSPALAITRQRSGSIAVLPGCSGEQFGSQAGEGLYSHERAKHQKLDWLAE